MYIPPVGFPAAIGGAKFGPGNGLILLDEVRCDGNEMTLLGCRAEETGVHNCLPREDAGVYCPCEFFVAL